MTREPSPTPRQLLARGLTREQARFAAWVLKLVASAPASPLSAARLADDWGTDRSWVCRALPAIEAAGVWRLERAGRLVVIAAASTRSLSPEQRSAPAARGLGDNERAAIRGPGGNEQASRCLSDNEQVLLLLDQRDLSNNNNNRRDNEQPTRQRARAARPSAPSVPAAAEVVSDEERNGGDLGRSAATEPAGQATSGAQHSELHVIETLLGGVGLLGRSVPRLAHRLVEQAAAKQVNAVELAQLVVERSKTAAKENRAGWVRRCIEGGWHIEPQGLLPGATASHSKPAGAPNQPSRAPLQALPRVSPTLWDVDLEGAVILAISKEPHWVARARTWMGVHGGVDHCLARMREQVRRAPADLEGVALEGGIARWRSVVPQLEQYAAKARELAVKSGAIASQPEPMRRGGVA